MRQDPGDRGSEASSNRMGSGLTYEGQDDSEQRGCWEGNGHVHLQHLQEVNCRG